MAIDIDAAERFMLANARLLDRHRLDVLLHGGPAEPVLAALRAYRNPDGGFGHALEPDVRSPHSEPVSALHALEVLVEIGTPDDPMVAGTASWVATVADRDGGVPFVLPSAAAYPRAPWMVPSDGGSHLTFGIAGHLWRTGHASAWLTQATDWCWAKLARPDELGAYWLKFALYFLDRVPESERASAAIEGLRPRLAPDGTVPVAGGTENERLTPLDLAPRPDGRSRALFDSDRIAADVDRLADRQQDDGGWTFDWLGWSPGQTVEWRGTVTLRALVTLAAHGRLKGG
jgi:hypothetical protein